MNTAGLIDLSYNIDPINGKSYFVNLDKFPYEIFFNRDSSGNVDLQTPLPLKLGWSLGFRLANILLVLIQFMLGALLILIHLNIYILVLMILHMQVIMVLLLILRFYIIKRHTNKN